MLCLRRVRTLLKVVGAIIAFVVLVLAWTIGYLAYESHRVNGISENFKPGMTAEEAVAIFPTDFFTASIGEPIRKEPCKSLSGAISPPEEYPALFPDIEDSDTKGKELAWDAAQIPFRLDRLELLDRHLRERKQFSVVVQTWSAYISNSDHPAALAYCRRGSAYLISGDFKRGYEDTKKSCQLGDKECCSDLSKLPKEKVAAIEAADQRIADNASGCEPPVSSFSLRGPLNDDKFDVRVYAPNATAEPIVKSVSRAELADIFQHEFRGREWEVAFTYLTATPQHLSFSLEIGRDGKLKKVRPVHGWD